MSRSDLPCFDELMEMNRQNPEKLEALRQQLTNELLRGKSPEQRRSLDQLVFRIEAERSRCKNPLGLCIRLSSMMHDRFWKMAGLLKRLDDGPGLRELEAGLRGEAPERLPEPDRVPDASSSASVGGAVISLEAYRQRVKDNKKPRLPE